MAQKDNDEMTGLAVVGAFIGVTFLFMAAIVFAIAALISLVLTVLCLFALAERVKIGEIIIEPNEAKFFLLAGVGGAFILPILIALGCSFLTMQFPRDFTWHMIACGYILGNFISMLIMAKIAEEQGAAEVLPPLPLAAPPAEKIRPPLFEYAEWDDEEKR